VLKIGAHEPTERALLENAHGLARYAVICQENGLVPIIEPEVLPDGKHTIEACARATQRTLAVVVKYCHDFKLLWEGAVLKPNMVLPGSELGVAASPMEVAEYTVSVLMRTIPPSLPGILFLSGGQGEEEAAVNLNAINQHPAKKPWALTFSYGRALQHSTLAAWRGEAANIAAAQKAYLARAKACSDAALGKYQSSGADGKAAESLHVKNYTY